MTHLFGLRINGIEGDNDRLRNAGEMASYVTLISLMCAACAMLAMFEYTKKKENQMKKTFTLTTLLAVLLLACVAHADSVDPWVDWQAIVGSHSINGKTFVAPTYNPTTKVPTPETVTYWANGPVTCSHMGCVGKTSEITLTFTNAYLSSVGLFGLSPKGTTTEFEYFWNSTLLHTDFNAGSGQERWAAPKGEVFNKVEVFYPTPTKIDNQVTTFDGTLTPEPGTLALMGSGLIGLFAYARTKK